MRILYKVLLASALAGVLAAGPAGAATSASGSSNGIAWQAQSHIVAFSSTATVAGGGNPVYLAQTSQYRGVVGLLMNYGAGGAFVCSGSLASDRRSIITAGHCVSNGGGTAAAGLQSVTAYFYDGNSADVPVYTAGAPGVTTVDVGNIFVNADYTGEVIDQNDIAVLRLSDLAPGYATSYDLYTAGDLTGQQFNVAGYGVRSDAGGDVGGNLGTGRLRQGDNRYDFRLGDADFAGFFDGRPGGFFGQANNSYSYLADFDNGLAANDASCQLATVGFGLAASAKFCNLGLGLREAAIDGGDSGGPQFINGLLAGVNSYGLSFGSDFGDLDDDLNTTFGEFSGYVPTFIHADWINSVLVTPAAVPEPASWMMMIVGFGFAGARMRKRVLGNASFA